METVKDLWNKHQNHEYDYASELWSMLMFQLWFNRYAANAPMATMPSER
jgi:asparagine synthase (glutamine-hydrolysing)